MRTPLQLKACPDTQHHRYPTTNTNTRTLPNCELDRCMPLATPLAWTSQCPAASSAAWGGNFPLPRRASPSLMPSKPTLRSIPATRVRAAACAAARCSWRAVASCRALQPPGTASHTWFTHPVFICWLASKQICSLIDSTLARPGPSGARAPTQSLPCRRPRCASNNHTTACCTRTHGRKHTQSTTSGGPLLNSRCELVGINTAILSGSGSSSGVGFAIPIDSAKGLVQQVCV